MLGMRDSPAFSPPPHPLPVRTSPCRLEYQGHDLTPAATTYNFGVQVIVPSGSGLLGEKCTAMSLDSASIQICEW